MTTSSNSGSVQPVQGGERALCSITGGPFAAIDAYVSGGAAGVQLELRLYATVGTLRTRIASALYSGPPVGIGAAGSLLEWTVISDPSVENPVVAGGTQYDLVVFGVSGSGSPIQATLAGTNAYDAAVNASATVNLPSNYGSNTIVTNVGCAQLGDVGVDQTGLPQNVVFDILASCGAGSVEARVATGATGGTDGFAAVIRDAKLPVATQYRAAVRETQGISSAGTVKASLATYASVVAGTTPASAITPGPQITVLRSVIPTAPTQVVWASSGYIDFVSDCGADPTGVVDCAAALERARVMLLALAANPKLAKTALTLFFPPGLYTLGSALVTPLWDFDGAGTSLTIQGCGDQSIFQFSGFDGPIIANLYRIAMQDMTFVGLSTSLVVPDCATGFILEANEVGSVERCKFWNILATAAVLRLAAPASWAVRDCVFADCASTEPTQAVLWSRLAPSMQLENCVFLDLSHVNGITTAITKANVNITWFRHDDSSIIGSGYQQRLVRIAGCTFDENCLQSIIIQGGPTSPVGYVHIEGCIANSPILGGQNGCIIIDGVDVLDIESFIATGFTVISTAPAIVMRNIRRARLRKIVVNNGSTANTIQANGTVQCVEIEESPSLLPANILTLAAGRTYITTDGIRAALLQSVGAVSVGSLLKIAPVGGVAGVDLFGTTDVGLALFVSLDAPGGSSPIRAALRGQRVTVISDGSTDIAIGDPITTYGVVAPGQVKKATSTLATPVDGAAMTAAASGGGPVLFDMWFDAGEF